MLLIAGGYNDPNIKWLLQSAQKQGVSILPLLTEQHGSPSVSWEVSKNKLWINGQKVKAQAAFVRRDVFHEDGEQGHYRATNWYSSICGWLACKPKVKVLNRQYLGRFTNKPQVLFWAQQLGLRIPETYVSNHLALIEKEEAYKKIAKPVTGGAYCQEVNVLMGNMDERNGQAACPAIVQQKVAGPDIRIYRIGKNFFGFKIEADVLDYRQTKNRKISVFKKLPTSIVKKLKQLMDRMGLDWGAADFKLDEPTGKYYFLEVNSNPMFSVFDRIGEGVLSKAMLRYLK